MNYRNYRNQKGQALVETALSIGILFLIVFGITEFGRAMYIWNTLNNAARAGARYGAVSKPYDVPAITEYVKDAAPKNVVFLNISVIPPSGQPNTGDTIRVKVQETKFQSVVPNLIPITNTLTGTASMRYE
ncbi:MAG: TadE family protein [Geobacteraceae bacterium]